MLPWQPAALTKKDRFMRTYCWFLLLVPTAKRETTLAVSTQYFAETSVSLLPCQSVIAEWASAHEMAYYKTPPGEMAARHLINHLQGIASVNTTNTVIMKSALIVRESSKKVPGS